MGGRDEEGKWWRVMEGRGWCWAVVIRVRGRRPCARSRRPCTRSHCPCARSCCPCARSRCPCVRSRCRCARSRCPVRGRSLCVGGASSSVGGGRPLWAGSLFVGAGLSIVAGGARSRGRGVRGGLFVVHGRGGDMSSAVWSSLARLEGTRVGVLTIDESIKNNDERRHRRRSSFGCHVALSDVAPAPPHPSPSVVMWRWSFAVVVVFGVWMVGDGWRWVMMGDDGRRWWWWE